MTANTGHSSRQPAEPAAAATRRRRRPPKGADARAHAAATRLILRLAGASIVLGLLAGAIASSDSTMWMMWAVFAVPYILLLMAPLLMAGGSEEAEHSLKRDAEQARREPGRS